MGSSVSIGKQRVGRENPPLIIAELSANHNGSLDRAMAIVDAAAQAGAHAIKLQTYTADTMTIDSRMPEFVIEDKDSLWNGESLYELYQKACLPWEWHKPIIERAAAHGILCFSSPFDTTAVEFLEDLNVPAYKIASFEIVHLPLIRCVAQTGKPLIISTGMATVSEIEDAVRTAREGGCTDLVLLKCTSTYPASARNSNLLTIPHLRAMFDCEVGLSDHTMGLGCSVAAVALGATVIEKHFTLNRADGGVDSAFSLEPAEMQNLVLETGRAWRALGHVSYGCIDAEAKSLAFRRSLYITQDLRAGQVLTPENLRIIRPGFGLAPRFYDTVLGKTISCDVVRGTALKWELVGG